MSHWEEIISSVITDAARVWRALRRSVCAVKNQKINLSLFPLFPVGLSLIVGIFLGLFSLVGAAQGQIKLPTENTAQSADSALIVGFPGKGEVSRIYADGRIERIEVPGTQLVGGSVAYGTSDPAPSPNNRHIAYVSDSDLWIMDVERRDVRKITTVSKERMKIAGVFITGWSWDSRRLLFYLQSAVESSQAYSSQVAGSMLFADAENFRIVDLRTDKIEQVTLPGRFGAWLPDGSFLLVPVGKIAWQPLWRWRPGQESPQVFVPQKASYGQFQTSIDGRYVLAIAHFQHDTSEVVAIDVVSGTLSSVTPRGRFAEYQWPANSPSGQRLAYLRKNSNSGKGVVTGTLIVEGKSVTRYAGWSKFIWVNEDVIALRDGCTFSVINWRQARVLVQRETSHEAEQVRAKACEALKAVP